MTAAPHSATREHPPIALRMTQILLFWLIAAGLVYTGHVVIAPRSRYLGEAVALVSVVAVAWAYSRATAGDFGVSHALMAGIVWVSLAVAAEIAIGMHLGEGWYALLGQPDRPLLRNVMLFVWVFAPAFFARGEDGE